VPKRNVEVDKIQSIREIIDIHKKKQEEEIQVDPRVEILSSPRPRRKLRETFLNEPSSQSGKFLFIYFCIIFIIYFLFITFKILSATLKRDLLLAKIM
jgi:hypothetical protein